MKTLFRNDSCYGSGERDTRKVIFYEVSELGNTDILEYCLSHFKFTFAVRDLIERLVKFIDGETGVSFSEKGILLVVDIMVDEIEKELGHKIPFALWLATRESVIENYNGEEGRIDEYPTSDVILSDLGEDGVLCAYEILPEKRNA